MKRLFVTYLLFILISNLNAQWVNITPEDALWVASSYFINKDTGFIYYGNSDDWSFSITYNGGKDLTHISTRSPFSKDLIFLNVDTGFSLNKQAFDTLYSTYDRAKTYINLGDFANNSKLYFNDKNRKTLFICEDEKLLISHDYGKSWQKIMDSRISFLHFYSSKEGYCIQNYFPVSKLLLTKDNGNSWSYSGDHKGFYNYHFISEQTGFGYKDSLWKTTDGGQSWFPIMNGLDDLMYGGYIKDIKFANEKTGYLVMYFGGNSVVYKTVDGGGYWHLMQHFMNDLLVKIQLFNTNNVILYSDFEKYRINIYRTTNGGGPISIKAKDQVPIKDFSIVPNPASSWIKIKYTGNKPLIEAKLFMFDMQGRLVKEETIQKKISELEVKDLKKGVYMIKIITGEYEYVEKVVLSD